MLASAEADTPKPRMGNVEVAGHRGDLVLAHFLPGHNKGGNLAAHVRRTIYYRLAVRYHPTRWESTFLDPWTEYPTIRRANGDHAPVSTAS